MLVNNGNSSDQTVVENTKKCYVCGENKERKQFAEGEKKCASCRGKTLKESEGRVCTRCQKWKPWKEFHKKRERFASKCKPCVRQQKKLFRKKMRTKRAAVIENAKKFKCYVRGNLTPSLINDVSQIFADAVRNSGG